VKHIKLIFAPRGQDMRCVIAETGEEIVGITSIHLISDQSAKYDPVAWLKLELFDVDSVSASQHNKEQG